MEAVVRTLPDVGKMTLVIEQMVALLLEMRQDLVPFTLNLTPEERIAIVKAPLRLDDAGQRMISTSAASPRLVAACTGFDGPTVLTQLNIARMLAPLAEAAEQISQLATDTRHHNLGAAYTALLEVYRIGKAMGETDAVIREVIEPMVEIYAARTKKGFKKEDLG